MNAIEYRLLVAVTARCKKVAAIESRRFTSRRRRNFHYFDFLDFPDIYLTGRPAISYLRNVRCLSQHQTVRLFAMMPVPLTNNARSFRELAIKSR